MQVFLIRWSWLPRPLKSTCHRGGIGRRAWFRSMYSPGCGGSSPFDGTRVFFFRPFGAYSIARCVTHSLRCGLHSFATSRLSCAVVDSENSTFLHCAVAALPLRPGMTEWR